MPREYSRIEEGGDGYFFVVVEGGESRWDEPCGCGPGEVFSNVVVDVSGAFLDPLPVSLVCDAFLLWWECGRPCGFERG